jgi:hypothetical protein
VTPNILFSVVANEPVEFEKISVEVQDFKKISDHLEECINLPQIN